MIVVLSLLRQALGLQQSPPNSVLISLSLFLTAIVMGPTFTQSYNAGIKPLLAHQMELPAAFTASTQPVKRFMLSQVDRDDLGLFIRLSKTPTPKTAMDTPLQVVTPAFMISELKRGFQIGFLLFIPFLVIDLVVASVLDEHGHDDAAAGDGQPAVQADLLRAGGRLAADRGKPDPKLPARRRASPRSSAAPGSEG